MLKIIIIEDHPIVAYNIKSGLSAQKDIEFVHTLHGGAELKKYENLEKIDLILLDINLPDIDGFEICKYVNDKYPHVKIIGISSFENYEYIARFINAGAHGYTVKGTHTDELIKGIHQVMKGEIYLCPIAKKVYDAKSSQPDFNIKFTRLEILLLELNNKKLSIQEISARLDIPDSDVHIYLAMLTEKIRKYNLPHLQELASLEAI